MNAELESEQMTIIVGLASSTHFNASKISSKSKTNLLCSLSWNGLVVVLMTSLSILVYKKHTLYVHTLGLLIHPYKQVYKHYTWFLR